MQWKMEGISSIMMVIARMNLHLRYLCSSISDSHILSKDSCTDYWLEGIFFGWFFNSLVTRDQAQQQCCNALPKDNPDKKTNGHG